MSYSFNGSSALLDSFGCKLAVPEKWQGHIDLLGRLGLSAVAMCAAELGALIAHMQTLERTLCV